MRIIQPLISLIVTGCLTHGLAAGPAIGIAMASGPFHVDRSEVRGNASLFDGSEVTTSEASSKLRIDGGARLEVSTDSQAKVFAHHAVLEKGAAQVEGPPAYSLDARTLRINAAAPKAIARVRLDGANAVLVSAVNGPVRVSSASGVLLANLAAGQSQRFQFEGTGCVLKKNGRLIVVDQATNQVYELTGTDLASELGNRVTIKGQAVTEVAPGGCLATAASVGADPLPGATPVHEAHGPNKAVITGVVLIGGGAAVGIAVALSGKSKSQ